MNIIRASVSFIFFNGFTFIGTLLLFFWFFCAIFADLIVPLSPFEIFEPFVEMNSTDPNGVYHILGTDMLGRSIFARIIYGSRTVIIWSFTATAAAYAIGIILGLVGGYYGKKTDEIISFIANVILSFPVLILYILFLTLASVSALNIVLAIIFAASPGIFRIVRSQVLDVKTKTFVKAAMTRGESSLHIMFFEILPNCTGPLIVDFCLRIGYTTITIGVLGFLGLGFPPPTPDWGTMISENRAVSMIYPYMTVIPVIALSSFVLGMNLLADGMNEFRNKH